MAGGGVKTPTPPLATEHCRYVGVKGPLRRVLTRSVLACGCAPRAASAPALDPASAHSTSVASILPLATTIRFAVLLAGASVYPMILRIADT